MLFILKTISLLIPISFIRILNIYRKIGQPIFLLGSRMQDIFPDNVLFDDACNLTGIIDFYHGCYQSFLFDIAICLNAWCFNYEDRFDTDMAQAFLKSYHDIRPLTVEEWIALPCICKAAALRFFLRRFQVMHTNDHGNALVVHHSPMEYYRKARFHFGINHYTEYRIHEFCR